jgi:hypothetical protein
MPFLYNPKTGSFAQNNCNFLWDWIVGNEPRKRFYGQNDIETQEMMASKGADKVRNSFYNNGCQNVKKAFYRSADAFKDTVLNPFRTPFQVGGFAKAMAMNNGDGTVTFLIPNVAGTNSFFYHVVSNRSSPTGPMSNIYQTFQWTEKIDSSRCRGK